MILSLILAVSENGFIGRDNRLPWHLPADLKHFRALTLGKPIIMGRRTYESLGRPLPERRNILLTRDPGYQAPGCVCVHSVEAALQAAEPAPEVMIIGGAEIYRQFLPRADRLYVTLVHREVEGDARFPPLAEGIWELRSRSDHPPDEKNPYAYSFLLLERTPGRRDQNL